MKMTLPIMNCLLCFVMTRSVLLFHKGKIIMLELEDQSKSPLERALDDLIERHLSSRANTRKSLVTNVKASIFDPSSLGEYLNKFSSLAMNDTLAEGNLLVLII